MPPTEHRFKHGEPVWAHMDGYPWWPGHIVNRNEVMLDSGESEPRVREGEVLVEFFNDNKRFAPMQERGLRFFLSPRYTCLHTNYNGKYRADLDVAVQEARDYCTANSYKTIADENGRGSRAVKPTSASHEDDLDVDDDDHDSKHHQPPEERIKKRPKPRKKTSRERRGSDHIHHDDDHDDADDRDHHKGKRSSKWLDTNSDDDELHDRPADHDKKRKKKKHHRSASPAAIGLDRDDRPPRDKSEDRLQKRKQKRKHRDVDTDGRKKKHRDPEHDARRKRRDEDLDAPSRDKAPRVANEPIPRKKRRKDSHVEDNDITIPIEKDGPAKGRKSEELTEKRIKDEAAVYPKVEKVAKREKKEADDDGEDMKPRIKREYGIASKPKAVPRSTVEEKEEPVSKADEPGAGVDSLDNVVFEEDVAYKSLSREQLVSLIVAKDRELRFYRVQAWQLCQDHEKEGLIKTKEELRLAVAPAFKAVSDFLRVNLREAGRPKKSAKLKELENLASETLCNLRKVNFDVHLLREDPRLTARAFKLGRNLLGQSSDIARMFRALIVQWSDMMAAENEKASEEEHAAAQVTNPSSLEREDVPRDKKESRKDARDLKGEKGTHRGKDESTKDNRDVRGEKGSSPAPRSSLTPKPSPGLKLSSASRSPPVLETDVKSPKSTDTNSAEEKSPSTKSPPVKTSTPVVSEGKLPGKGRPATPETAPQDAQRKHSSDSAEHASPDKSLGSGVSRQERHERRVNEFSPEQFVSIIMGMLTNLPFDGDFKDEKKRKKLAVAMEELITPRRDEDKFEYFKASKKFLSTLSVSLSAKGDKDDEAKEPELRSAFFECVKDVNAVPSFVKRIHEMYQ